MANDSMTSNRNDTQMGDNKSQNQTMQHEQAKASISGERQGEQSGFDKNRQSEQGMDRSSPEKSAIGGGENFSQTGEPGRARNELDDQSRTSETSGQQR